MFFNNNPTNLNTEERKVGHTALISVFCKKGIVDFTRTLLNLGFNKIISSGGTAKCLRTAGIPVTEVSQITGMSAILDHRVVTLHPKIFGGILALDVPRHDRIRDEYGIPWIDLVCVDFYPLEEATKKSDSTIWSVQGMMDIGGPSMIRAAAKADRIVICQPDQRQQVIDWLKDGRPDEEKFKLRLAIKALEITSQYDLPAIDFLKRKLEKL